MSNSHKYKQHNSWDHPAKPKAPLSSCKMKASWVKEAQVKRIADRESNFQGNGVGYFNCSLCGKFHLSTRPQL